jgi:hydroxymethylpyrimidine pyrophosphatase-like HAD family hydrolase
VRYHALAADYDGTLARHGTVAPEVRAALAHLRSSGRRLLLVTGRRVDDLLRAFPQVVSLFDRVVADNGGVLFDPTTQRTTLLAEPPPLELDRRLTARGVSPVVRGDVVVATHRPHEAAVLETVRELGLELQLIFNWDSVMILPSGVNKATGLAHALRELRLSPHNVVATGDGENDHALLAAAECGVAVANAVSALKERADWVTTGEDGDGVREIIEALLHSDLAGVAARLERHEIPLGTTAADEELRLPPYGRNILVAGTSGSGKSTFATAFVEGLQDHGYQFCIVDPEGDYEEPSLATVLGDRERPPRIEEVLELLDSPDQNVAVNLIGLEVAERPAFFASLLPRLQGLRAQTGRPHWILVDETHHLLPEPWEKSKLAPPRELGGMMFITVHPEHVRREVLEAVDHILVIGHSPAATLATFDERLGLTPPPAPSRPLPAGEALIWTPHAAEPPLTLKTIAPRTAHRRHIRKYAEGELPEERSFYFRGRDGRLNLRAQNLLLFLQIAEGVDDETWLHHLERGDYSRWFREKIKDADLARQAATVEHAGLSPRESRDRIRALIGERYTAPV